VQQGHRRRNALTLLKSALQLLPDLRTDKAEGQANFVNPASTFSKSSMMPKLMQQLTPKLKTIITSGFDHTAAAGSGSTRPIGIEVPTATLWA